MPITTDYHLHSEFSEDCNTPMEEMIKKALSLGMTHLCFTEHMDMDYPSDNPDGLSFLLDTHAYREKFLLLQEKYLDKITLLWGVELGIQPHITGKLTDYALSHPFDFIIASSHLLYGADPYYPSFFKHRDEEQVYGDYFSEIIKNIKSFPHFDVYGHLDYIVRYGPNKDSRYSYEKYRDLFDKLLRTLIENGKGLEINTGGLKYGLRNPHPHQEILMRYRQLGGEIITVGSDAHNTAYLQYEFSTAAQLLSSCGFQYYTIFQNRKPMFIPL